MIWGRMAVKRSNQGSEKPGNHGQGTPVWLSGWPLAIPSVGIALVAALLAVPHSTKPRMVPTPVVHRRALNAEFDELSRRSHAARTRPLSFAVREVGEAYRRLGRTQFDGPVLLDDTLALGWQRLVRSARRNAGDEPLLALRAVQVEMFVKSLDLWEATGKVPDDLAELGGDFAQLAQGNQWWKSGHLDISREARWALGLLRWTTLAGLLQTRPYRLSRELEVIELRFFFSHANTEGSSPPELRQRILTRYSDLDPDYPIDYARGVLAAQSSQFDLAAVLFARQLQAHPEGSYATRARNHLIWATQQMHSLDEDVAQR
jgi:hypothetical protein